MAGVVMQSPETKISSVEESRLSSQKDSPDLGKRISSRYDTQTLEPCE